MATTEKAYLTKRVVERATRKGMKIAAQRTMDAIGYIVVAREGWLMKVFPDGQTENIRQLEQTANIPLILD